MADILLFPSDLCPSDQGIRQTALQPVLELPNPSGADAPARAGALDTRRSFIVEAPAGSGKTGLLVQRFLNLLADPSTSVPEEILALTFTRKATAELRERIVAQLEAAAASSPLHDPASPFEAKTRSLAEAVLVRDRQAAWRLLTDPRRLRIQTIDALCMEIAGTLPLLSGSAVRRPVDDASELYREAARNTLRRLGGPDRPLHAALETVLLHRDGSLADVETLLADMLATREQWAELVPLDRASLSDDFLDQQVRLRLERTLESIVCSGLNHALRAFPPSALAELAAFAHEFSAEPGYAGKDSPIRLCSDRPGPPAAAAEHLEHWRSLIGLIFTGTCGWRAGFNVNQVGFSLSKAAKERLRNLIQEIQCEPLREALESVRCIPPAKYPDPQWHQAKALFRLLLHALAELRLLFAETGKCDFTEFSLAARQALGHHGEAFAASPGVPLRHLLVDEMQDTSSAQYDLLTALTRTWDGSSQTLFLVGDPKQSIYLFRQARVERFLRTTRDGALGDIPLHPLQLTANFRSRPAVVAGVNRDFAPLFTPPGQPLAPDTVDVPFVAATATRPHQPASGVHWHTRIVPGQSASSEASPAVEPRNPGGGNGLPAIASAESRNGVFAPGLSLAASSNTSPKTPSEQDAAAIRCIVERWRATPLPPGREATAARPAQPWRIAVLAAARTHLAPIVAEFSRPEAPIPYRAVKVEPLAERPEVLDAFALTRALCHPADRTAWMAVLRAPWCGLDAADLLVLAAEADPAHTQSTVRQLVAARAALLSPTGRRLLARAWPTLQAALEVTSCNSVSALIERTWRSLGGHAPLSREERTNVESYFALLREAEIDARLDLRRLKRSLEKLYAESIDTPGAVELMTIHGSKGLEWDVVIVPDLGKRGQPERARLLNWLEIESGHDPAVLLAPIQSKGETRTTLYQWLDKVHCRRLEAERKRVFYVACTRAREELHLFATARHGRDKLTAASGSLLHACWPAAAPHFEQPVSDSLATAPPAAAPAVPQGPPAAVTQPGEGLALAAVAAPQGLSGPPVESPNPYLPRLTRLPLSFDPGQAFREAAAHRLPYVPAAELPLQQAVTRPEGSMAVRALGNVAHRFLEQLANRLAAGRRPQDLTAELPTWLDRLTASLRTEGLSPADAGREANRALTLLAHTLADPVGLWLLHPHADAASERALSTTAGLLRVDRSFRAGPAPLSFAADTLWIVDFKTTAPGGRSVNDFLAAQRAVYGPQLARYAATLRGMPGTPKSIQLGLYFPAIPRLLHWPAEDSRLPAISSEV